jgi:hypothetical protein
MISKRADLELEFVEERLDFSMVDYRKIPLGVKIVIVCAEDQPRFPRIGDRLEDKLGYDVDFIRANKKPDFKAFRQLVLDGNVNSMGYLPSQQRILKTSYS